MRNGLLGFIVLLCSAPLGAEIELQQADGSRLILPAPANRIITLSPHLTELAFAAGAGGQIIATVEYSNFPESAVGIPRVGDAFRLDLERIISLQPELVIAWQSGNPRQAVERLAAFDIPAWSVEIRDPAEIATVIEAIGLATDNDSDAGQQAADFRERLQQLARSYSQLDPVDYFYQVAARPLFTVNGQHLISRSLALCGGRNIFADEPGLAHQISHEAVIVSNPAALIAPVGEQATDPLASWRDWPSMQAVNHDALILLPADEISRATPRLLDAVEFACRLFQQIRDN
jgi:iron complex transport system substrate-binding protein